MNVSTNLLTEATILVGPLDMYDACICVSDDGVKKYCFKFEKMLRNI